MKKKIIGIIIIVAIVGGATFFAINRNQTVEVNTAVVVQNDITKYVEELGVVKTEDQVTIYANTSGRVTEVLVDVGDWVRKGDPLIRIDSKQLYTQIKNLEAQRYIISAQYQETVKAVDDKEIEKLQLQVKDAEVEVQEAERLVNNNEKLYEAGAITHEVYQETIIGFEAAQRHLERVKLELELVKKPQSQNIHQQFEGQLRQIDIQLEDLNSRRADYEIYAPIEGRLLTKEVEVGAYLQPGMQIMEIGNTEGLYIESDILVADIANVGEGAEVVISHKDLGITDLKGRVNKIHPQAFTSISDLGIEQKRIKVDISIEGATENLRPGYDLDIKIIVDNRENVLAIPESAIFKQEGKYFVFLNKGGIAVIREIQKGLESQRQVEILSGLQEGEVVILSPDAGLEEGVSVVDKNN